MANFLQLSEPEAAELDAQSDTQSNDLRLKNQSSNALVAQYGPEAADPALQQQAVAANTAQQLAPYQVQGEQQDIQKGQMGLTQAQLQVQQDAALKAALALQSAVKSGQDVGTAYDSVVGPNAAVLGLSPTDAATLRAHLVANPSSLDALVTGLAGPAKPIGEPQYFSQPNGTTGVGMRNERGGFDVTPLPAGASPIAPAVGAPVQVQNADGSWSLVRQSADGRQIVTPISGTPVQGIRAQTGQENAQTGAYSAGVRGQNSQFGPAPGTALPTIAPPPGAPGAPGAPRSINQAIIGQESGGNPNAPTSVDNAHGIGQITHKFFQTFARPGENIDNPADNLAIANRGINFYAAQYKDPARVAVAYFSGPDNVAPPGSPTPWKTNAKDGNGTATSTYVQQVLGRMGAGAPGGGQGSAPGAAPPSLFSSLPPKGRVMAVGAAQGLVNGSEQLTSIDSQIANIGKLIGPWSVGLGSLTDGIPGTPAANLKAALSTLRSQGFNTWLQGLKNSAGQTGIGRVLQSEATNAMNSFGALEQSQSEDQFRYHLGIFQQRVHQMQSNAEQAFTTQYGTDPYSALGVKPTSATPSAGPASTAALRAKYGL